MSLRQDILRVVKETYPQVRTLEVSTGGVEGRTDQVSVTLMATTEGQLVHCIPCPPIQLPIEAEDFPRVIMESALKGMAQYSFDTQIP